MVSLLMMLVYRREGQVSKLISPVSQGSFKFMGEIYVDDTEILTMVAGKFDKNWVLQCAQANLNKWAYLLNATGGVLNPFKCYWYMVSYKYHKEQWIYDNKPPESSLMIPLPDGSKAGITLLPVTEATKVLGVWSSLDSTDATHLNQVVGKKSANGLTNSRMHICPSTWHGRHTSSNFGPGSATVSPHSPTERTRWTASCTNLISRCCCS
jgi:hypothetical protein